MSIKKMCSDFHAKEFQKVQNVQGQINKLKSYDDSDFIIQRDTFNKEQKRLE